MTSMPAGRPSASGVSSDSSPATVNRMTIARSPGAISGTVINRVVRRRLAPAADAASSSDGSMTRRTLIRINHIDGMMPIAWTKIMPSRLRMLNGPSRTSRPKIWRSHMLPVPARGPSSRNQLIALANTGTLIGTNMAENTKSRIGRSVRSVRNASVKASGRAIRMGMTAYSTVLRNMTSVSAVVNTLV